VRKLALLATAFYSVIQVCSAATCTNGTLAAYLSLGSGGCTIGGDLLSNFQTLSGTTGATVIAPSSISIAPSGGGSDPTLTFTTNQTAVTSVLLESIFTFEISGASYTGSALSLSNSSETVDGAVTDIENFCAGGTFGSDGVSGCTGTAGSLLTLDVIQNSDQSALGPAPFVNVTDDFTVDGGTAGSATGGTFTDSFMAATSTSATPEPATVWMVTLVLTWAAALGIRNTYLRRSA
jgi:hypothetical protein